MLRRMTHALLAAGTVALLVSGCASSGGTGDAGAPPVVSVTPTPTSMAGATLPLDAYRPSQQGQQTLIKARVLLTASCMKRLGFTDWTQQLPSATTSLSDQPDDFGFLDAARAAAYGFHSAGATGVKTSTGGGISQNPHDAAEFSAQTGLAAPGSSAPATAPGIPQGGCDGEAMRKLGYVAQTRLYSSLTMEAWDRTKSDSRVVAATQAWSACMKGLGYTYSAPGSLATEAWAATPTPEEIATAKADVTCTVRTNLKGVALGIEQAVEQQQVAANQQALEAEKAAEEAEVRKAEAVVQGQA